MSVIRALASAETPPATRYRLEAIVGAERDHARRARVVYIVILRICEVSGGSAKALRRH